MRTKTSSGAENPYSLFMRRSFCAPPLRRSGPLSPLKPGGTSFNTQNPIPYKSQKTRSFLETTRAKERQRGRAGAAERAKEGCEWLPEGSDTRLGAGCRVFESPHSDHCSWAWSDLRSGPSFLLKFSAGNQAPFLWGISF